MRAASTMSHGLRLSSLAASPATARQLPGWAARARCAYPWSTSGVVTPARSLSSSAACVEGTCARGCLRCSPAARSGRAPHSTRTAATCLPGTMRQAVTLSHTSLPHRRIGGSAFRALAEGGRRWSSSRSDSSANPVRPASELASSSSAPSAVLPERRPFSIKPYLQLARLHAPIGTWLLFWPCAWSITLASHYTGAPWTVAATQIALFGTGAIVMRGAGCTINDMWDSRMDRLVERTKSRPLASGAITHTQALAFLGIQLSAGLAVLVNLNWYSIVLGTSSLGVVVIYPLMKRITYWPQFVLGLAFNWGALLGWSAVAGSCNWQVVLPMYAGSVAWTLVYDTIYAHQDKTDDVSAGVKSTALLFGEQTKPVLSGFSTAFLGLLGYSVALATPALSSSSTSFWSTAALGEALGAHPLFFGLALPAAALHLRWQIRGAQLDSRPDCWRRFCSNRDLGLIIWLGLAADYALWLMLQEKAGVEADGVPGKEGGEKALVAQ